jgi:hypothetical protein
VYGRSRASTSAGRPGWAKLPPSHRTPPSRTLAPAASLLEGEHPVSCTARAALFSDLARNSRRGHSDPSAPHRERRRTNGVAILRSATACARTSCTPEIREGGAGGCGGGATGRSKRLGAVCRGSQRATRRRRRNTHPRPHRTLKPGMHDPDARCLNAPRANQRAVRSVSLVIARQNSAIRVAVLSTSTSETISFGECM